MVEELRREGYPVITFGKDYRLSLDAADTRRHSRGRHRVMSLVRLVRSAARALLLCQARPSWPSETSKCRARLAPYCAGRGLDIGFGGDPIVDHAIRVDLPTPYAAVGRLPVQLAADGRQLPCRDELLDFVYSSHLLEDFADTEAVLREWLRVLKPGGRLILYCPDEAAFRRHCAETGQPYNTHHAHQDFRLDVVRTLLLRIGGVQITHAAPRADDYSWELVAEKTIPIRRTARARMARETVRLRCGDRVLVYASSGLGDDLMVFWAAAGAACGGWFSGRPRLFFEREETRAFLCGLARRFPEVEVLEALPPGARLVRVRHTSEQFRAASLARLLSAWLRNGSGAFCEPYQHKWLSEYGNVWRSSRRQRLAAWIGLLRVWTAPYEATYDGWQQLGLSLGLSAAAVAAAGARLACTWTALQVRVLGSVAPGSGSRQGCLLFPSGGSFQDFDTSVVNRIRAVVPSVRVVRFVGDGRPSDLTYASLSELQELMAQTDLAITNDSLASHLAQFCAGRHILICSRSRPGNVCFPGASRTAILDLGEHLPCRPCAYRPLRQEAACPAGLPRCDALRHPCLDARLAALVEGRPGSKPC